MTRRTALWLLAPAMLALGGVLLALDARMEDAGGPGIVSFEFAWSEERVRDILGEWGEEGRDAARLSLWLDYGYLLLYGAFWALAAAAIRDFARRLLWRRLAAAGSVIVAFPVAAAVLDALENAGLLLALDGRGGDWAPLVAGVCASGKFLLIGVAIGYVLIGLARRLSQRSAGPRTA